MGRRLNRSHTSILKEIRRNNSWCKKTRGTKYKPIEAEKIYKKRRHKANFKHIKLWRNDSLRNRIEKLLMTEKNRGPDEIL